MSGKFKAIVVGAGGISGCWFPALKEEEVEIVAVVDLSLENAKKRIAEFGLTAEAMDDYKKAFKKHKADFAVDLTIPDAHCAVTCAALKAGLHVIGEKPMSASMAEARKMVKAAEQAKKIYMIGQSRRWDNNTHLVSTMAKGGEIGNLTTANCDFYIGAHFGGFRDAMDSPLILDMSIHHFDMVRYFTGCDPVAVYAKEFNPKGSWYKGDVAASCIFEMTNGLIFTYRGSWCAEGCHTEWNGNWRLIGDKGTLLYGNETPMIRGQKVEVAEGFFSKMADIVVPAPTLKHQGQRGELNEFLDCLRTGKKPQTECHDNIKSLAMVFAAIESSRKGKRVLVKA